MSDEIKKICNNCDNLQYGFGESSINYGPRCFEKDCGVDENDTCDMFEIASYLKVKKLQGQNKELLELLKEADSLIDDYLKWIDEKRMDYFDIRARKLREALAKVNNENN